jgi:hypothetical protein
MRKGFPKVRTQSAFDLILFVHVDRMAKTDDNELPSDAYICGPCPQ